MRPDTDASPAMLPTTEFTMARKQFDQHAEAAAPAMGEAFTFRMEGLKEVGEDTFQLSGVQVTPVNLPFDDIAMGLMSMGWTEREAEMEADDFCRTIRIKQLSRLLASRIEI